jgi:hypothetical protein
MKMNRPLLSLAAGTVLFGMAAGSSAQDHILTTSYTNTFASASSLASWIYWYDIINGSAVAWDGSMDAATNSGSGSMKVSIPWPITSTNGDQQLWFGTWDNGYGYDASTVKDGTFITNIGFDIYVDPSSPTNPSGNFGSIQVGFVPANGVPPNAGFAGDTAFWNASTVQLPAAGQWSHINVPVDPSTASNPITDVMGILMQMNTYGGLLTGTTLFWIDNLAATARPNDYTNSFDTQDSDDSWLYWYDIINGGSLFWDANKDANNNPNSGSLMVSIPWPATSTNGDQEVWFGNFAGNYQYDDNQTINAYGYTNILVSVHLGPSSPTNTNGTYGTLQVGFVNDVGGNWNLITWAASAVTLQANATTGWTNIVVPIDLSVANLGSVGGIGIALQTYGAPLTGTTELWFDNLAVVANTAPPPPPPTLSNPVAATPGLNLFSEPDNGSDDQRTSIEYSNSTGNGWLGAIGQVSYSLTIAKSPGTSVSNYQTHIFLLSGNPPSYETSPDYNETNLIFLDIETTNTGGAGHFRFKVNEPKSNVGLYSSNGIVTTGTNGSISGTLVTLLAPSINGTWTMSFSQNTNVTLSGPGGVSTNFVLAPAVAAAFVDPLSVYLGAQPNEVTNIGLDDVMGSFSMTGNANAFTDNFTQDSTLGSQWIPIAADTDTVQIVPPGGGYWIQWTSPDIGFSLETGTSLLPGGAWTLLTGPHAADGALSSVLVSGGTMTLVPQADLPGPVTGFFKLVQGH